MCRMRHEDLGETYDALPLRHTSYQSRLILLLYIFFNPKIGLYLHFHPYFYCRSYHRLH